MAKLTSKHDMSQKGILLIEIILSIALFGMLAFVVLSAFVYGRDSTNISGDQIRASEIANEGIEAVHNIAANAYSNLTSYINGTTYYLNTASSIWVLSTTLNKINGVFTPIVTFSNGPNSYSRQVTVKISWQENTQRIGTVQADTYLSNWQASQININQTKTGLLVYANGGTSTELIDYRLLQSTGTWTNPTPLPVVDPLTDNEVARSVKLYPAQTGVNKVVLARFYDGTNQYIYGIVWNGSTWGNVQKLAQWPGGNGLDSGNYSGTYMANGTFLAVYNDETNIPKYNTWNGTSWSTQGSLPAISSDHSDSPESMIVEARPGNNEAVVVMLGLDYETVANFYNGSNWQATNTTLASNGTSDSTKMVDFAWSPVNNLQGVAVFTQNSTDRSLRFSTFTDNEHGGGSWGSVFSSSAQPFGSLPESVAIAPQTSLLEQWMACDKDAEASQNLYCYTVSPTTVSNPTNQLLTNNASSGGQQSFDLGYGLLTGTTGLASYGDNTSSDKLKRLNTLTNTWDSTPISAPNASTTIEKTRLIPEPGSNDAMLLMIDNQNNLYSIMYNSSNNSFYSTPTDFAWTIHNANGPSVGAKWFDFAWDQ